MRGSVAPRARGDAATTHVRTHPPGRWRVARRRDDVRERHDLGVRTRADGDRYRSRLAGAGVRASRWETRLALRGAGAVVVLDRDDRDRGDQGDERGEHQIARAIAFVVV